MAVESVNPSMAESAKVIVSALYLSGSCERNIYQVNECIMLQISIVYILQSLEKYRTFFNLHKTYVRVSLLSNSSGVRSCRHNCHPGCSSAL